MPTLLTPLGKTLELGLGTEATFGVKPAGPLVSTPVYTSQLDSQKPMENDPILGGGQNNSRDATPPAPGLVTAGGQIVAPLDVNHIGHWLHLFFGAAAASGSGVVTHVFTSGKAQLPSKTIQQKLAGRLLQTYGVVGRTMRFELGQAAGFRRVTMDLGAKDDMPFTGGDIATNEITRAAALADARVPATRGELLVGGVVVATLLSFDGTYDTALAEERYVDNTDTISGYAPGDQEASWRGSMTLRWNDATYDTLARGETDQAMTVRYVRGANQSLSLSGLMRLERAGLPISGPGKLQQQVTFRGMQGPSAPMLTATLVNAIASYA
ncbi:phage tail tube protein [Chenggangzhangella methanolivorans]|uniref:Phage tail protein n=1 Tax=Chenggangzhangella methanolivorans TaxID=1437009 RepID=A0A9E6REL5_9HYPH|nr:phage tail tube protein [Chenggangzhangella methanolivorans]QZN99795.1 hypothetical protein K6K41_24550 [Chenggangzhangella methanolivorans]